MAMSCVGMLVFSVLMMELLEGSMGAVYSVGDGAGWNSQGTDYKSWTSSKKFQCGDTIVFNYNPQFHNVLEVSKEDFKTCSSTNPIATYTAGSDPVVLSMTRKHYFICGFPGMCHSGQKVEIKVSSGGTDDTPPAPGTVSGGQIYYYGNSAPVDVSYSLSKHGLLLTLAATLLMAFCH